MNVRAAILILVALSLTTCQSAPPPAADAKAVAYGDWTVKTSGYVRVESGVVK